MSWVVDDKTYPHRWSYLGWGKLWQRDENQIKHPDRKWFYENLKGKVLDVGCGNCVDEPKFKDSVDYVGVDVTFNLVKSGHFDYLVEKVVRCDGRFLPFHDKCFDTAYSKDLLLHYKWENAVKFIDEMFRVANTVFVAWGLAGYNYYPSNDPIEIHGIDGFYYNRFSLAQVKQRYNIKSVSNNTSISLIEEKK